MNSMNRIKNDMHPAEMGFLYNQWYVAAMAPEIADGKLLRRIIMKTPVVLYRTEAGEVAALYDRCPHRGLPLSMGKRIGDELQCGYHGVAFGTDGRCTRIPSQAGTPSAMAVQSFPVVEKWEYIWIWMGDPEKADVSLLPDHEWMGIEVEGHTAKTFAILELKCNYTFFNDNLLDASHLSYVHHGTLDNGELAGAKFWTEVNDDCLLVGREEPEVEYSGPIARFFRTQDGHKYHRTHKTEWKAPSTHVGWQTLRDLTDPDAPPIKLYAINALTPLDERTTHVFHVMAANYPDLGNEMDLAGGQIILKEDSDVLEALQRDYDEIGNTLEVSIAADNAGVRARRILKRMIDEERAAENA